MELNKEKIGKYLEPYDEINSKGEFTSLEDLQGINSEKYFQECKSNKNDIDLYRYRICRNHTFAYNKATSRNGEKISIAYRTTGDCLISPSYQTFRIKDTNHLNPEYLMLCFKEPNFDKYARFNSWGSATEFLSWEDFCDMEIVIPSIDEQKKIVKDYNIIIKRIKILEKEEQFTINICESLITEYLSKNNEKDTISNYCIDIKAGGTPSRLNDEYWNKNDIPWIKNGEVKNNILFDAEEYISDKGFKSSSAKLVKKDSVLMAMYCVSEPQLAINEIDLTTNQAVCSMTCDEKQKAIYLYYYLMFFGNSLMDNANGTAQQNLSKEKIENYEIVLPNNDLIDKLYTIYNYRKNINRELRELKLLENDLIVL